MDWKKLLSSDRERSSQTVADEFRNPFDLDYDRVVSSSSLRRLQDKTQVFPLQENDFTRTRLTHSLEVSAIGRSIGRRVGKLLEKNKSQEFKSLPPDFTENLSSLLAVTGLVHDLGNPPFGHYGETIIRSWAKDKAAQIFPDDAWVRDYEYFDGNAQTIRIVTRLQNIADNMGMNFAFGTLATLLKYPWSSEYCICKKEKKLGYFFSEKTLMENVINNTGMHNNAGEICRHPATFLLEAADDIAYLFADLEDGCKKNCFSFSELNRIVDEYALTCQTKWKLNDWLDKIDKFTSDMGCKASEMAKINAVRIYFQGRYIETACDEFIKNYDDIMAGNYNADLLECSTLAPITKAVKEICGQYIFNNKEVLMLELAGKTVVNALLDKFSEAVADKNFENSKYGCGKLFALISENFKHAYKANTTDGENYKKLQLVVDFISGMTDSYALNLHRALTGVTLP